METNEFKQKTKTYRISHKYDVGDRSIYLECDFDPTKPAVYLQFKAEEIFDDDGISLSNLAIANGLVSLYGASCGARSNEAVDIDMYFAREGLCGMWYGSDKCFVDQSIERSDALIIEALKHHIDDQ